MFLGRVTVVLAVAGAASLTGATLLVPATARAERATTRDALDRLEEILEMQLDDGLLLATDVLPAIVVSTAPRYEESRVSYGPSAIGVLSRTFGNSGLRLCEACMVPRTFVSSGRLERYAGPMGLDEIIRLDDAARGTSQPARTAIWLDEHERGVALRIVDLQTARVVFARNVDPTLHEHTQSARAYARSRELERRARGDSLAHAFVDVALFPGQHVSLDWTEQWGETNANLSGVVISLFDPVMGIGGAYYRCLDFFSILVGAKVIMSFPSALARAVSDEDIELLDPIVTGVFVMRVPFGRSNYGGVLAVSTNGQVALGISLLNISLLPVLP